MVDRQRGIERKRRGMEEEREREGRRKEGRDGGAEGGDVTLILVEIK